MTISAKVILDSISPSGVRLVTCELLYPRFIHAEFMTHRVFSRNAASSRAIPTAKKIERIRQDCAKPSEWGINQKGMQSGGPLDAESQSRAARWWQRAADEALIHAEILCGIRCSLCGLKIPCACPEGPTLLDLHKQVANRILEPFDHIATVVTSTRFGNHRKLRLHPAADPTYQELAKAWHGALDESKPRLLLPGEWHLPYVDDATQDDIIKRNLCTSDQWALARKVSVGRCARVSYQRQGQADLDENVKLHDRLAESGHWSPFEHQATPIGGITFGKAVENIECNYCSGSIPKDAKIATVKSDFVCQKCAQGHVTSGNFLAWAQYRKEFAEESGEVN